MYVNIACIIMASGEGKRFGGNKLLSPFRGEPLYRRIIRTTSALPFSDRLVVTRHMEIAAWCRENGVRVLLHDLPERNRAIRLGLEALTVQPGSAPAAGLSGTHSADAHSGTPSADACLFCPADQPLVTEESLRRMLQVFGDVSSTSDVSGTSDAHGPSGISRIIRLSFRGQAGAPVLFPASLFPELMKLPPASGGKAVIARHPELVTAVEAQFPEELSDVDTPEDLRALEMRSLETQELEGWPTKNLSAEAVLSPINHAAPEASPAPAEHAAPDTSSAEDAFGLCKTPAELEDLRFTLPGRAFTFAVRTAGILIHEGRVLLQKTIGENEYYLPGGHVQPFEATEQTLVRELREELHSEVEILDFAGIGENFFPWEGRTIQQLCFYYRVRFRMEAQDTRAAVAAPDTAPAQTCQDNAPQTDLLPPKMPAAPGIPTEGRFEGFDTAETERYHLEYVWVPLPELEIPGRIRLFPEKSRPMITGNLPASIHFIDTQ